MLKQHKLYRAFLLCLCLTAVTVVRAQYSAQARFIQADSLLASAYSVEVALASTTQPYLFEQRFKASNQAFTAAVALFSGREFRAEKEFYSQLLLEAPKGARAYKNELNQLLHKRLMAFNNAQPLQQIFYKLHNSTQRLNYLLETEEAVAINAALLAEASALLAQNKQLITELNGLGASFIWELPYPALLLAINEKAVLQIQNIKKHHNHYRDAVDALAAFLKAPGLLTIRKKNAWQKQWEQWFPDASVSPIDYLESLRAISELPKIDEELPFEQLIVAYSEAQNVLTEPAELFEQLKAQAIFDLFKSTLAPYQSTYEAQMLPVAQQLSFNLSEQLTKHLLVDKIKPQYLLHQQQYLPLFAQNDQTLAEPNGFVTLSVVLAADSSLYLTGFQQKEVKQAFVARVKDRKLLWLHISYGGAGHTRGLLVSRLNGGCLAVIETTGLQPEPQFSIEHSSSAGEVLTTTKFTNKQPIQLIAQKEHYVALGKQAQAGFISLNSYTGEVIWEKAIKQLKPVAVVEVPGSGYLILSNKLSGSDVIVVNERGELLQQLPLPIEQAHQAEYAQLYNNNLLVCGYLEASQPFAAPGEDAFVQKYPLKKLFNAPAAPVGN